LDLLQTKVVSKGGGTLLEKDDNWKIRGPINGKREKGSEMKGSRKSSCYLWDKKKVGVGLYKREKRPLPSRLGKGVQKSDEMHYPRQNKSLFLGETILREGSSEMGENEKAGQLSGEKKRSGGEGTGKRGVTTNVY